MDQRLGRSSFDGVEREKNISGGRREPGDEVRSLQLAMPYHFGEWEYDPSGTGIDTKRLTSWGRGGTVYQFSW